MAVQISGNDITVPRDGSFTRNVTIGGTLTYEDVTNIDSVGIVTARAGVLVGSGITLSKDGDIFATGVTTSTTFVGNLTGNVTGTASANAVLTGSTNNTVTTVTGANAIQGEANLQFDGTNIGVGVAPSGVASYSTIHLKGQTSGNGGAVRLTDYGDTPDSDDFTIYKNSAAGYLRINGTDPLIAYLNGADRLRIDSKGQFSSGGSTTAFDGTSSLNGLQMYYETDSGLASFGSYSSGGGTNLAFYTNSGGSAATEKVRINSSGQVFIGDTVNLDSNKVNIFGTKAYSSGIPQQQLAVADAQAYSVTDNGGSIGFLAKYSSGGAYTTMGSIEGVKHNNIDGNYQGAIAFKTRNNNGDNVIRMRLTDNGLCFGTDTAGANALDDYEEGFFTPTLRANSSTTGQQNGIGKYTKIGNMVSIIVDFEGKDFSSIPDGDIIRIDNMPITSGTNSYTPVSSVLMTYNVYHKENNAFYIGSNSTSLYGIYPNSGAGWSNLSTNDYNQTGVYLNFSMTYFSN